MKPIRLTTSFAFKTGLSEANVKINRMATTKSGVLSVTYANGKLHDTSYSRKNRSTLTLILQSLEKLSFYIVNRRCIRRTY